MSPILQGRITRFPQKGAHQVLPYASTRSTFKQTIPVSIPHTVVPNRMYSPGRLTRQEGCASRYCPTFMQDILLQ